jgi:hypothetical protein
MFLKVTLVFFNLNPVHFTNQVKNLFQDSAKTSARRKDGEELSKDSVVDPEPVFLNVYGATESIPRNEFRQPM